MTRFFTRERFGQPQVLAGMLLLVFLAQCAWLVNRSALRAYDLLRIHEGLGQWRGQWIAGTRSAAGGKHWANDELHDSDHSALWYLIVSGPLLVAPEANPSAASWLAHAPYLIFGVLLGASLWYVARRLYGNAGGYIALLLYSFSPGMIRSSAVWFAEPELGAAWGAFGAIFTAIAVAHTLYAPREVVLWNWRRILLLGVSLALAVGCQFSLIVVLPLALAFMLYVAPERRSAATIIWAAAVGIGALLLFASYFFHADAFWQVMRHASFLKISWRAFVMPRACTSVAAQIGQSSPALVLALPVALVTWALWPRGRYFGNTAPLLVAVLLLLFAIGTPHYPGLGFQLVAVPFLFVFVSGIAADLLETRNKNLVRACLWGLLAANAGWSVWELARVGR
jgi:hypothetical protein